MGSRAVQFLLGHGKRRCAVRVFSLALLAIPTVFNPKGSTRENLPVYPPHYLKLVCENPDNFRTAVDKFTTEAKRGVILDIVDNTPSEGCVLLSKAEYDVDGNPLRDPGFKFTLKFEKDGSEIIFETVPVLMRKLSPGFLLTVIYVQGSS